MQMILIKGKLTIKVILKWDAETTVRVGVWRMVLSCWSHFRRMGTQLTKPGLNENFPGFKYLYSQPRRLTNFTQQVPFISCLKLQNPRRDISCKRKQMNEHSGFWMFLLEPCTQCFQPSPTLVGRGQAQSPCPSPLLSEELTKLWVGASCLSLRIPQYHMPRPVLLGGKKGNGNPCSQGPISLL